MTLPGRLALTAGGSASGVGALLVAAGGLAGSGSAALGALVGWLCVLVFFGFSLLVWRTTLAAAPRRTMAAVVGSYLTKLVALLVALSAIGEAVDVSARWFALTVLCCAAAWLVAEAWTVLRGAGGLGAPGARPAGR